MPIFTDLEIDGTAGGDTLVITATGPNSGSYVLNGGSAIPFSGITSLTFNGLGSDDVLTINNPGVDQLTIPIFYDGGGQSGDGLEILGGVGTSTTYTATGTNSGIIAHTATNGGVQTTSFTGIAPVTDTVTEATFTIVGTTGADTITITDGGIVSGDQTWLISSPTFESMRVANKTTLIIDGNGGGDTVSMDTAVQAAGLLSVHILGVNSVSETGAFNVQNLTIDAANSVALTGANNVDNLSAHLSAINGFVEFRDLNGFTVDGISTNGGRVTLATDAGIIVVGTASPGSGIDTGAGNIVRLQATTGDVSQTANGAIVSDLLGIRAGGAVTLTAATNDNASIAFGAAGQVQYRDGGDVTISAVASSGVFTALAAGVSSGGNNINLQVGGNLLLNDAVAATPSINAGTADARIVAGGTVSQLNLDDRIVADELGIIAGGAVTLAAGDNAVNTLAVATTGLVEFRDVDDLTVGAVAAGGSAGFTGASGIGSGGNNVNLQAGAVLQVAQVINAGVGDVRLVAAGISQTVSGGIVADELGAIASSGVVSLFGNALNDVNTVAMAATAGVIYQDADGVTIGTVAAGGNAGFTGATGMISTSVLVITLGPIAVANNVTATAGNVTLQAADTPAPGDDITVNSGVTVQAPAGNIALNAGDNLNLLAGSSLVAGGFVQGVVDFNNADPGAGGTANLNGSISAPGIHQFLGLGDGDTFFSATGPDVLLGNAGNDRFVWDPGDGSDTIDGGADTDTLAFNGAAANEQFALNPAGAIALFTRNVGAITMTMTSVERLELAAGNGTNQFTVADMTATGLTGPITYTGGTGVDTISAAGAVNPFNLSTGAGNDQLTTGAGADRLRGEGGDDFLNGGAGNDTAVYAGNVGDYQIAFLPGNDVRITDLRSGAPEGVDTLRGIEDAEFANATLSILFGTPGDDSFVASGNQAIVAGLGHDTATFDFRLVDATVTYAGHSVLIESATTHTVVSGFETYVFTDGTVNNNDADVLVDDLFYYSQNHDVWTSHADADQHFHQFGRHENRDPNAFFSTNIYLSANADVKAAGVDPLIHFDQVGFKEGRVPSLTFDPRQYLAANPDVAAAHVDPLAHFLAFGAQEGRLPFASSELVTANGFDYVFYLQHNPDVAAAHVDPFVHFQTVGWQEGRNPNALFDITGYLGAYADVAAAHVNPLDHYDHFGRFEGRDPSVGFDTTSYLAAYPDVAAAGVNPLVHFLAFGIHEGRSPFADGVFG